MDAKWLLTSQRSKEKSISVGKLEREWEIETKFGSHDCIGLCKTNMFTIRAQSVGVTKVETIGVYSLGSHFIL